MFMILISALSLGHSFTYIKLHCAKTTIRLWHTVFVQRQVAHDFHELLSPHLPGKFVAVVQHDEIRAIGYLRNNTLRQVAYSPDHDWAAPNLIENVMERKELTIDYKSLRSQKRLYCECLYLSSSEAHGL